MAYVNRRSSWRRAQEDQQVKPVRRVVSDEREVIAQVNGRLVLPMRGGVALLSVFHQLYDRANVVAIDLWFNEQGMMDIRKFDRKLEIRIQGMLRKARRDGAGNAGDEVRMRLVEVLG